MQDQIQNPSEENSKRTWPHDEKLKKADQSLEDNQAALLKQVDTLS